MSKVSDGVRAFFEGYARSRTTLDLDLIASQYADSVLLAGPGGARAVDRQTLERGVLPASP